MFRLIRVRLALSYAGIALLVTLCLGAVLLVRLRAYYSTMELDYLNSNAKAMSVLAAPMLIKKYPKDIQDAQVSNMAFLSQTRVRILDPQKNVLADSGPWQSTQVGLGVVKGPRIQVRAAGITSSKPSSVIILQRNTNDTGSPKTSVAGSSGGETIRGNITSVPVGSGGETASGNISSVPERSGAENGGDTGGIEAAQPLPGGPPARNEPPDVIYFSADVPVSNGVYGLYLSKASAVAGARSDQKVLEPILQSTGAPLGYVELSQSPAYGREIVNSVASGLAVAGGLAILLAIGAGWLTSRRLTAPLLNLTEATQQMSGGDLSVRVSEAARKDEFGILGKSFNQMAGRIEETIQTLRRFLSDAAHELQTPLTALRTNLELAKSESNSPAAEDHLSLALEQIDRLQRLIKDLLSLSRLESANGHDAFQAVDLNELIRQVSEPFAARAEQAGQSFELDLVPGEVMVIGSPEKLRSALGNLLDNALKFTPSGGTVTVRLRETEEDLRLSVIDNGIGIPPEEIEMLFSRFHRGRNASTYPGSGLGLAIVRAIAQAHGGSVQAMKNPRGGATFTLILPCSK